MVNLETQPNPNFREIQNQKANTLQFFKNNQINIKSSLEFSKKKFAKEQQSFQRKL